MTDNPINTKSCLVNFDFYCFKCGSKFDVFLGYMNNKSQITCPNCNQMLPVDTLMFLKNATQQLECAVKSLKEKNEFNTGWNFSLHWDSFNRLPNREKYDKSKYLAPECIPEYEPFQVDNPDFL